MTQLDANNSDELLPGDIAPAQLTFPENLPISAKKTEIIEAIESNQVVIIAGETGSGKTTQIGKLCLLAQRGQQGIIGHTQPRRIAARTIANHIASELKVELGRQVGCQFRFHDQTSEATVIKLMTDGILLSELQQDNRLSQYDTLIIDEAHERSLNIDFILGFLKQLLPKRPQLKLIITSATIDINRFSQHFNHAPIIEVSGRTYPVETLYLPPEELHSDDEGNLADNVVAALKKIVAMEKNGQGFQLGDVLAFLPGEREIRETSLLLKKARIPHLDILPLYARLSTREQQRIFSGSAQRRVILATNVAETSITVPGIRYVIDTGVARISRYSYRSKIQRLPIEPISQASANQRQGRCGRTAPGICLRLYDEKAFSLRPQYTQAEILRTNLAQVILQMLNLKIKDINNFPFLDQPDSRYIRDGFKLLAEIGAVTQQHQLTKSGRQLNQLPVDPRLGRMLLAAQETGCMKEMLIIVSGLSIQDPRERPADKQTQSSQAHVRFADPHSDFMTLLNLWHYSETLRQQLSQNQWRKHLQKEYISVIRMREWRDIHHQLHLSLKPLKLSINQQPASMETIHQAMISGLLSHICQRREGKEYLGASSRTCYLFPGSNLYKKPPAWLMSLELVETSKLYARMNAKIEPHWALRYARHLLKYHYSDPAWSSKTGHVMANRRTSLYGLTLVENERVSFGKIDPKQSRALFIRQALVEGGYADAVRSQPVFWQHNQQVIDTITTLEAKARRQDILVDETMIYEFYDQIIPHTIHNLSLFEQWRKKTEGKEPTILFFDQETLMIHSAANISEAQFPDQLTIAGQNLALTYHFEPSHRDDGVTLHVPLALLRQVPVAVTEWLVPGLIEEKCVELLKRLPKAHRKQIVPIPGFVRHILTKKPSPSQSLYTFIQDQLKQKGIDINADSLRALPIDDYYCMNFHISDDHNQLIAHGRDLAALQQQCQPQVEAIITSQTHEQETIRHTEWNFGALKPTSIEKSGIPIQAFPAVIDLGDAVTIRLQENEDKAAALSRQGITRLLYLSLPQAVKYLHKNLFRNNQLSLILVNLGLATDFKQTLLDHLLQETFLAHEMPDSAESFQQCINQYQGQLIGLANQYESLFTSIFKHKRDVEKKMKNHNSLALLDTIKDMQQQLQGLFHKHLLDTPYNQLKHYPRYLNAMLQRFDKLAKDKAGIAEMKRWQDPLWQRVNQDMSQLYQHPELVHYRWLLEEYRVSIFAQALKTAEPVSAKRLKAAWPTK